MEIFNFCIKAVCKESEKFNLFFEKENCKIEDNLDQDFHIVSKRLAYMYKFASFKIHFFKKCMLTFSNECPQASKVINDICAVKLICSLSIGPGIDIIGLLFTFQEMGKALYENVNFKILNLNGSWRNSMQALTSIEGPNIPLFQNFKLLTCNVLKNIVPKVENYLKEADVILMDHAFESKKVKKETILKTLNVVFGFLKPGTYVILIDKLDKLSYVDSLRSYGDFLYGPKKIQLNSIPFDEMIIQMIGEKPKYCGEAGFGIWCKRNLFEDVKLEKSMKINVVPAVKKSEKDPLHINSNQTSPSPVDGSKTSSFPTTPEKKTYAHSYVEKSSNVTTPSPAEVSNNSSFSSIPVKKPYLYTSIETDSNEVASLLNKGIFDYVPNNTAGCAKFDSGIKSLPTDCIANKNLAEIHPIKINNDHVSPFMNTEKDLNPNSKFVRIKYNKEMLLSLNKSSYKMKLPDITFKNVKITNTKPRNSMGFKSNSDKCFYPPPKGDINLLLKTLDCLVTKLEKLVQTDNFSKMFNTSCTHQTFSTINVCNPSCCGLQCHHYCACMTMCTNKIPSNEDSHAQSDCNCQLNGKK